MARDRAHEAVIADVDLFRDLSRAQLKLCARLREAEAKGSD